MRRLIVCLGALLSLTPASVLAAPSPDTVLLWGALADAPSIDYVESGLGTTDEGSLTASDVATLEEADSAKRGEAQRTLSTDGFAAGYGRVWTDKAAGVVLAEEILAFGDQSGANAYFATVKRGDHTSLEYKGDINTSSIPNSYGIEDLAVGLYAAAIAFAKGNDILVVGFVSTTGYMVSDVQMQAKKEFLTAPDYTIQPGSGSTVLADNAAYDVGALAGHITFILLLLGIPIFLIARSRRGKTLPASVVQMSADGHYWWDGSNWQDATLVAPGHAQRTPDGTYWWDGQTWHPVPRPQ